MQGNRRRAITLIRILVSPHPGARERTRQIPRDLHNFTRNTRVDNDVRLFEKVPPFLP